MRKHISAFAIALTTMILVSCTKAVDVAAVSTLLPGLQLSSVGMITPGPYVLPTGTATSTIQLVFGATTPSKTPGAFEVGITDATTSTTAVTLNFNSWSRNDTINAPSAGSISYTTVPSTYPNTTIYQGSIILKYGVSAPFTSGHQYTVKVTASTNDTTPVTSVITMTKLFYIQ